MVSLKFIEHTPLSYAQVGRQLRRAERKRRAEGSNWETRHTVAGGEFVYTRFWGSQAWEKASAFRAAVGGEMREVRRG